jgi:hypothetical protein
MASINRVQLMDMEPFSLLETHHNLVMKFSHLFMTKTSQSFTKQEFGFISKKLGVKNFLMDLIFKPKLEDWFPKVGVVFACVRTIEIWWESGTTLGPLYTLGLNL